MGASLGCCAGEALCCLGSQVVMCCGKALQCSGALGYPMIISIVTILSILFRFIIVDDLDSVLKHMGTTACSDVTDADAKDACYGNQMVYRLGFSMVLFFATMFCLVPCFKKSVHDGGWLLKVVVIIGTFIGSLWIKDDAMAAFAVSCLVGSAIFIVVQNLIFLEWVYSWSENWAAKIDEEPQYQTYLLLSSIAGYVGAIVFIVLACVQFAAAGCGFAIGQITWTCIACFTFSLVSVLQPLKDMGIAQHGSLLCSSMMSLYCCFYCWSALTGMSSDVTGDDGHRCNTLLSDSSGSAAEWVNVIFGLVLTCFSIFYSAYSSGTGDIGTGSSHHHADSEAYARMENGQTEASAPPQEDDSDPRELMQYHFIMVVCSMFMVMTIVNWDVKVTSVHAKMEDFGTGQTVVWAKTLSQWLTILLYIWSLVAEAVLKVCGVDRDF